MVRQNAPRVRVRELLGPHPPAQRPRTVVDHSRRAAAQMGRRVSGEIESMCAREANMKSSVNG
jgi:hypothetical protein